MNNLNTICDYVEVFVPCGKVGVGDFYTIHDKLFKELKIGDEFRIKLHGECTNYCHDMYGRERFICASDAYYENLRGWIVDLELNTNDEDEYYE